MINKPLSEYPRPQLVRDSYLCLNGEWEYAIRKSKDIPDKFDGKIIVPFSPETTASGVNKTVNPDDYLFYKLDFKLEDSFIKDKVILHFMAVDQIADVYLNGKYLGQHIGGYLPFEFEIKDKLAKNNTLILRVIDRSDETYLSRGKQKIERGGIWYTPQSGIYLPVWMESVSNDYIKKIKLIPDIDNSILKIEVFSDAKEATLTIENKQIKIPCNIMMDIKIDNMILWSPENPYLYQLKISTNNDKVQSYFAMRKISKILYKNHYVLALNNKPYFMKGVLDQGYYKNGLYTPEKYDDYISDLSLVKSLGFNTIRKHIKIEAPRWYYECDKLGILVWQDFVNGGGKYRLYTTTSPLFTGVHFDDHDYRKFARTDENGRKFALEEFNASIEYLFNVPSIVLWTIFNEGWGQFDSKNIYEILSKLDPTRLFDHASGWHDQGISDVKSLHIYFKRVRFPAQRKIKDRAVVLSEFGGYVLPIKGHMQKGKRIYSSFNSFDDWFKAYKNSIELDVLKNIPKGLCATIYTQLSDVEDELNGFVTFDREIIKVDVNAVKEINDKITF